VNHTRLPKEDYLRDWARRDNQVKNGDRVGHDTILSDLKYRPYNVLYVVKAENEISINIVIK
jgi:hypothetical protein